MRRFTSSNVMFVAVMAVAALPALGQQQQTPSCACVTKLPLHVRLHQSLKKIPPHLEFGAAYDYEWFKASATQNQTFALQGGSSDIAYSLGAQPGHFAIVARVNGETATNLQPGLTLSEIRALAGPRFTHALPSAGRFPKLNLYVHGLFGYVYGFNGVFPQAPQSPTLLKSSADSFALQLGAGLTLPLHGRLGARLIEADFVQTDLPNNANNHQNDIQLSAGITFRLGRK